MYCAILYNCHDSVGTCTVLDDDWLHVRVIKQQIDYHADIAQLCLHTVCGHSTVWLLLCLPVYAGRPDR